MKRLFGLILDVALETPGPRDERLMILYGDRRMVWMFRIMIVTAWMLPVWQYLRGPASYQEYLGVQDVFPLYAFMMLIGSVLGTWYLIHVGMGWAFDRFEVYERYG